MGEHRAIRPQRVADLADDGELAADLRVLSRTTSTMDEARRMLDRGTPPFVVLAESQTAGRGRMERVWESPPGENLTFTAAIPMARPLASVPPFTLALGVGLHRVVQDVLAQHDVHEAGLTLKWPNDLLVGDRKVAGVLSEATERDGVDVVLAGVGLNVNTLSLPGGLAATATSLRRVVGAQLDRESVLASVLGAIQDVATQFARGGFASFGAEYASRCTLWGRSVQVEDVTGTMHGVDGTGALVLRHADGTTTVVSSGTLTLR